MKKLIVSVIIFLALGDTMLWISSKQTLATSVSETSRPIESTKPPVTVAPEPTDKPVATGKFKDGTYDGPVTNAYFGDIQVRAVITSGKISDVSLLKYPDDRPTSIQINTHMIAVLKTETITNQNATVNIVSGATQSTEAYQKSLAAALAEATL